MTFPLFDARQWRPSPYFLFGGPLLDLGGDEELEEIREDPLIGNNGRTRPPATFNVER